MQWIPQWKGLHTPAGICHCIGHCRRFRVEEVKVCAAAQQPLELMNSLLAHICVACNFEYFVTEGVERLKHPRRTQRRCHRWVGINRERRMENHRRHSYTILSSHPGGLGSTRPRAQMRPCRARKSTSATSSNPSAPDPRRSTYKLIRCGLSYIRPNGRGHYEACDIAPAAGHTLPARGCY